MGIDLSPDRIDAAATRLEGACDTIEGTSTGPAAVDAGEVSPIIESVLSGISRSTGVIVEETAILAANAHVSAAGYRATDEAGAQRFRATAK